MSYPDKEQIGKIEQGLEKAEQEFRRAYEARDFALILQAHKQICKLVAELSAAIGGGKATVFASFLAKPEDESCAQSTESAAAQEAIPDIAVLEKQLAELASKMQKCLEAGDMDGMLQANEKMGQLSELMAQAEALQKDKQSEKSGVLAEIDSAVESSAASASQEQPQTQTAGWSAGDTLAFAKQRAQERKKQQKLADSFETVVGQVLDKPESIATTAPDQAPPSALFNDRMKAKLQGGDSGQNKAVSKPAMNQEQLREKLEEYSFYEVLAVPSTASFEELHKSFLRKIRRLNKKLANNSMLDWQFQEFVAALCLAHDVLKYPNARLQYDLVMFGPQDGSGMDVELTAKQKMMPLNEMLKFSTLVKISDLSVAIEKHRGNKDERAIGYYLVEQGLLSSEELDSILFAQKLVSAGKLTVAQFELAMQEMRENSIPLLDTLVASEWIQPQDVFSGDLL